MLVIALLCMLLSLLTAHIRSITKTFCIHTDSVFATAGYNGLDWSSQPVDWNLSWIGFSKMDPCPTLVFVPVIINLLFPVLLSAA